MGAFESFESMNIYDLSGRLIHNSKSPKAYLDQTDPAILLVQVMSTKGTVETHKVLR
jgi:hypothetical protein